MITPKNIAEEGSAGADQRPDVLPKLVKMFKANQIEAKFERLQRYTTNETASYRRVAVSVFPKTTEEVSQLVEFANRYHIPVYPVSTGRNWGYGGASPVTHDCIVADLSRMNKIVDFDTDLGLVTLQPGVTQAMLHEYLTNRGLRYLVPVTGAGPHCSVVANAVERGYGVTPHTDHFGAVTSLTAVLPTGEIYRSPLSEAGVQTVDRAFKWGIGPYLDGLFSQSNLGVVTEMTIALAPVTGRVEGFLATVGSDEDLAEAVAAVQRILRSVGSVMGSINLMNGHRMLAMFEAETRSRGEKATVLSDQRVKELLEKNQLGAWSVGGIIYGDPAIVRVVKKRIRRELKALSSRTLFFNRQRIDRIRSILSRIPLKSARRMLKQVESLSDMFKVGEGHPSEVALPLCYLKSGQPRSAGAEMNPARDGCGLIWYSPLVPMKPALVREYVDMVKRVCAEHQIEPLITLTSLSDRCFDSTVPILFDREDSEFTRRAKACYRALFEAGRQLGVMPYRLGIDHMDLVVDPTQSSWRLTSQIKQALDPQGIIAPGRYCPNSLHFAEEPQP